MVSRSAGRTERVRWLRSLAGALIAAAVIFCVEAPVDAMAQSGGALVRPAPGNSKSFNPLSPLLKMFGVKPRKQRKIGHQRKTTSTSQKRNAAPRVVELPKDPDAGVVLVVGDRMARGVAEGLKYTLADKPMVRVEMLVEDKGGFAGDDAPDWAARALARVRAGDVKAVVVMMGRMDLGQRFPGEPPIEFATSEWWAAYGEKTGQLIHTIRQERKPVVWVGLAPTGSDLTNSDFLQLNSAFRSKAEEERGHYVDIWDIFLTDAGGYSSYGPDVDGKNQRLRTSDKIGFTWPGYRKVAFFVERQLSRLLGGYGGLAFEGVEDDPNFIVLTGRTTSPEDRLLGGEGASENNETETPAYRFFVKGEPLPVTPGRIDYTKQTN